MFCEVTVLTLLCANVLGGFVPKYNKEDGPLILTPYIENGETEKARELSAVDPSIIAGVESHAAYFTVNETGKWNLFFWYFPVQGAPVGNTPLIIWLQGGPGGSSLFGLFSEIGPIQIVDGTAQKMPITWGSNYSLLFIDNPVGTGFSYSDGEEYATNEDEVGACLLSLLQQFLQVFPELRGAPLFIAGESYAGKYIPAFGHYIHLNNNESMPINLKGLAIGDGWIDPPTLQHYSEWALQTGLADPEQAAQIHEAEENARKYWEQGNFTAYAKSAHRAFFLLLVIAPVSAYNYLEDTYYLIDNDGEIFLNKEEVQSAIHVKKMNYTITNNIVLQWLSNDFYDTVKPWLEELLEHYGVMCYNGQLDMIVAYALSVHTYRSLKWSGAEAYRNAERVPLYDEKHSFHANSFVKASGNFMDVMVRGAGHMVPTDQPRAAKQMLDMFINKFK